MFQKRASVGSFLNQILAFRVQARMMNGAVSVGQPQRLFCPSLGCVYMLCFAMSAHGGITADWNSTTKTLTVTYTSADVAQITDNGFGDVEILEDGTTPITIYEGMNEVDVDTADVVHLVVDGSSGGDWIDCYHVTAANGWTGLSTSTLNGNGGGDDIDGTYIGDVIYAGAGNDAVFGDAGADYFLDYDSDDDTTSSCAAVNVDYVSATGVLDIEAATGSEVIDLEVSYSGSNLKLELGANGHIVSTGSIAADEIVTLNIAGTNHDDVIDCQDVTDANGFDFVDFVNIDGGLGDDTLTGTEFRDRFISGTGEDTIDGKAGDDYIIDYDSTDDTIVNSSAVGLSEIWHWDTNSISRGSIASETGWQWFTWHENSETDFSQSETLLLPQSNDNANSTAMLFDATNNYRMLVPAGHIAPEILSDGSFRSAIYKTNSADPNLYENHCQFNPYISALRGSMYCYARKRYRFVFTASFSSNAKWEDISWCVITQLHPGNFPDPWHGGEGGQNPCIALRIDEDGSDAEWVMNVKGSTEDDPEDWESDVNIMKAFEPDTYEIAIEYTIDYKAEESYTRIDIDGELLGEVNSTNGINHNAFDPGEEELLLRAGIYPKGSDVNALGLGEHPEMTFINATLYSE